MYKVLLEGDDKDKLVNGCNPYKLQDGTTPVIPNSDGKYLDTNGDAITVTAAKRVCAIELTAK